MSRSQAAVSGPGMTATVSRAMLLAARSARASARVAAESLEQCHMHGVRIPRLAIVLNVCLLHSVVLPHDGERPVCRARARGDWRFSSALETAGVPPRAGRTQF